MRSNDFFPRWKTAFQRIPTATPRLGPSQCLAVGVRPPDPPYTPSFSPRICTIHRGGQDEPRGGWAPSEPPRGGATDGKSQLFAGCASLKRNFRDRDGLVSFVQVSLLTGERSPFNGYHTILISIYDGVEYTAAFLCWGGLIPLKDALHLHVVLDRRKDADCGFVLLPHVFVSPPARPAHSRPTLGRVRKRNPRNFYCCLAHGDLVREKDRIPFGWCFRTHPWEKEIWISNIVK